MNSEANPYTPPAVEELTAEQRDFPWYVAARGIHVQDGAVLPEIDLETGNTDPPLEAVKRKFVKAHWSMGSIGLGPLMFLFLHRVLEKWDAIPLTILITVIFTIWLAVYLVIFLTLSHRITFTAYFHPTSMPAERETGISVGHSTRSALLSLSHRFISCSPTSWPCKPQPSPGPSSASSA